MARALAVLLVTLSALALIAVACDSEGDFLLDDEPEATGTPPFLQRSPQPSPAPSPVGSPPVAGATPVTPFEVETGTSVTLRSEPSTEGGQDTVAGSLTPGDTATVTAQIPGEEVESGNDIWYQLDDGSFVYSGAVTEVGAEAEEEATPTPTTEATQ
jgi:hypothetical protein